MTSRTKISIIIFIFVAAVFSCAFFYLLGTTPGLTFGAALFSASLPAETVTVGGIEGTFSRGAVFRNVEISDIRKIPGGVVRIQEMRISPWGKSVSVKNGRLELRTGEVISFSGGIEAGRLHVNIYSGLLYSRTLLDLAGIKSMDIAGRITGIDLYLSNTSRDMAVAGTMKVEELTFRNFSASDFPLRLNLAVRGKARRRMISGRITAGGGVLASRFARMEIREGSCDFSGDPVNPQFRFQGTTTIADTRITAVFSGTVSKPDLQLSSQPPLPQDRLMVMLLTGQGWQGTANALSLGRITPGLVKDLTDFFLFGGSVDSLEKKLGITDFAIIYGRGEKGFEVHKSISNSTDVIYGVSRNDGSLENEKQQTQTVGLEYKLTETISLEGRQRMKEKKEGLQDDSPGERLIRLKFKKSF